MFARGFKTWCENVAVQQRRELGLAPADPLDPWRLAAHLRITVWTPQDVPGLDQRWLKVLLRDDPDSWSAATLRTGSQRLIILNSAHSGGRPASNLTHELSHLIMDHTPARVDVSQDGFLMLNTYSRDQEEEANWLSGSLLLPREALMLIRRQGLDHKVAAKRYGVSLQMLQYRLKVTAVDVQLTRARQRRRG
ncbi:MAG: ImmA/IrrE family metallo-endopeptidase [bacterium]